MQLGDMLRQTAGTQADDIVNWVANDGAEDSDMPSFGESSSEDSGEESNQDSSDDSNMLVYVDVFEHTQ